MEQFSLEKWLKNKNRIVITRDGRPVRILDYNLKGDKIICIAINDKTQESITTVDENGHCLIDETGWHESNFDLFFANEKELTEFNKALQKKIAFITNTVVDDDSIRELGNELLDLAKKEILKDLPKWKKCDDNLPYSHIGGLNERYLIQNGYCIKISDLRKLPKEE